MKTALMVIGATFAAAVLVFVFFVALLSPEPDPTYAPDECTPEPDGFCATWYDYHENDWGDER